MNSINNYFKIGLLLISFFSAVSVAEEAQSPLRELSDNTVWIDVRSWLEYKVGNIEGDAHIPHKEIVDGVEQLGLTKDTQIALYCQSGGRSAKALMSLQQAGYHNVIDAGGISDVKKLRFTSSNQ